MQRQSRAARASRVRGAQSNRGVSNHRRRAADQPTRGVERQPGGKPARAVARRVVARRDLVGEGRAHRSVGAQRTADDGGWRQNLQPQGGAARASRVRGAQGNRGVSNRCRRAADQPARGIKRQPGGQAARAVARRVVAGCDLVGERHAHRGVGAQRTRDGGRWKVVVANRCRYGCGGADVVSGIGGHGESDCFIGFVFRIVYGPYPEGGHSAIWREEG